MEIEYLAPYLPYKLKVLDTIRNTSKVMNLGQGTSNNWIGIKTVLSYYDSGSKIYKPILRLLSDFNYREPYGYPNKEMFYEDVKNQTISVKIWNELLTDHIDVFGLIEKGLAIDINTLEL